MKSEERVSSEVLCHCCQIMEAGEERGGRERRGKKKEGRTSEVL